LLSYYWKLILVITFEISLQWNSLNIAFFFLFLLYLVYCAWCVTWLLVAANFGYLVMWFFQLNSQQLTPLWVNLKNIKVETLVLSGTSRDFPPGNNFGCKKWIFFLFKCVVALNDPNALRQGANPNVSK
jgi:hypothetical protein